MRKLSITFLLALFAQSGGQPINIPIPITSFSVGYGSRFSQDLGVTPAQLQEYRPGYAHEGVYTLTFSVANNFPNYPGYYKSRLSFGTQELCEPPGWGTKTYSQVTFVCPISGYLIVDQSLDCDQNPCITGPPGSAQANANSDLFLTVTGNGWPTSLKNASLTFTPE